MKMTRAPEQTTADLVRRLVRATGLSREGVYKCLREKRKPRNPLIAKVWQREISRAGAA
jgi:DNA-binding phage protein